MVAAAEEEWSYTAFFSAPNTTGANTNLGLQLPRNCIISSRKYDSLVLSESVNNQCIVYTYMLLCNETILSKNITQVFMQHPYSANIHAHYQS